MSKYNTVKLQKNNGKEKKKLKTTKGKKYLQLNDS